MKNIEILLLVWKGNIMNKTTLIHEMSVKTDMPKKDVEKALNAFLECVESSLLNGEKVQLVGFGTFDIRRKGPRPGRNPKKPEQEVIIPASNVPFFKAGKYLKESLNRSEAL